MQLLPSEGLLTMVIGLLFLIIFPTDPERSSYLSKPERELAIKRIHVDQPSVRLCFLLPVGPVKQFMSVNRSESQKR
jgi:hypothetical protein